MSWGKAVELIQLSGIRLRSRVAVSMLVLTGYSMLINIENFPGTTIAAYEINIHREISG